MGSSRSGGWRGLPPGHAGGGRAHLGQVGRGDYRRALSQPYYVGCSMGTMNPSRGLLIAISTGEAPASPRARQVLAGRRQARALAAAEREIASRGPRAATRMDHPTACRSSPIFLRNPWTGRRGEVLPA